MFSNTVFLFKKCCAPYKFSNALHFRPKHIQMFLNRWVWSFWWIFIVLQTSRCKHFYCNSIVRRTWVGTNKAKMSTPLIVLLHFFKIYNRHVNSFVQVIWHGRYTCTSGEHIHVGRYSYDIPSCYMIEGSRSDFGDYCQYMCDVGITC